MKQILVLFFLVLFASYFFGSSAQSEDPSYVYNDIPLLDDDYLENRNKIYQKRNTYRHYISFTIGCQDKYKCSPDAQFNTVLHLSGFYDATLRRKMLLISSGLDEYPGTGWFLAKEKKEWEDSGKYHHIGPVLWNTSYSIVLSNGTDSSTEPRSRSGGTGGIDDRSYNAEFESSYRSFITGQFFISPGGTYARNEQGTKTGWLNAGIDGVLTHSWDYVVGSKYSFTIQEYELISYGSPTEALVGYTREQVDHGRFAKPLAPKCETYWDLTSMSRLSHVGFIPGFSATIAAKEKYFGGIVKILFYVRGTIAYLTGVCTDCATCIGQEQMSYYGETMLPFAPVPIVFTVDFSHPGFGMFQPILIKAISFLTGDKPANVCMQAYPKEGPRQFVRFSDCIDIDGKINYGGVPDITARLHWYARDMKGDMCLSGTPGIENLFLETCNNKEHQKWFVSNKGAMSGSLGTVVNNYDTVFRKKLAVKKDFLPDQVVTWQLQDMIAIDMEEAFEFDAREKNYQSQY